MNLLRSFYRFLSSRTLAVILLLALAGIAFTGSLVTQLSLAGVKWMVRGVSLHPVIERLTLTDIFQARWLTVLLAALMLNLLLCSVNRLVPQFLSPDQMRGLLHFRQLATSIPIEESAMLIEDELRAHRFGVRRREQVGSRFLAARRHGFSRFGSLLFHISLLVAFLGFMIRSRRSFEGELVLFPEQTGEVRSARGDTLRIQLVASGSEYNVVPASGRYLLRQRVSEVILYRNGHFERADTIRINHPIWFHELGLFQADPAQLFIIRVTRNPLPAPTHSAFRTPHSALPATPAFDTTLRLRENEPFVLAGGRYFPGPARLGAIYQHDSLFSRLPANVPLYRLAPGDSGRFRERLVDTLRSESPLSVGDCQLNLLNIRQGTRIAYRYDPALPWFYVAGALFLLGIVLRGFLPAYEFWATITEEEGETIIRLGGRALGAFTSLRPLVNRIVDRLTSE